MILLMNGLIRAIPGVVGLRVIDPLEQLQYFSWVGYVVVAVVYTALVFHGELSKDDGPLIFSKQNARPLPVILMIHVAFLAIILEILRIAPFILPSLPDWTTDTFRVRGTSISIIDVLFVIAMGLMYLIEGRWIYVESEMEASGTEGSSHPRG